MEMINVGGGEEFLSKTRIHTPQEKAYLLWEHFLHMQAFSMLLWAITAQQSLDKQKTLFLGAGKLRLGNQLLGCLQKSLEIYQQGATETHRENFHLDSSAPKLILLILTLLFLY